MKKFSQLMISLFLIGCSPAAQPNGFEEAGTLRLATTTSTYDSGLLDEILPDFEARFNVSVEIIAVGTGQALALGEQGDVDVVLVHAPAKEIAFVEAGHGTARYPVMYNDFVLVGPPADPANVASAASAAEAFSNIAQAEAIFVSRGDNSGTHTKELAVWQMTVFSLMADADWYLSLGQGMGESLIVANEKDGYILTDRGTFLALRDKLPYLVILLGGDTPGDNPDSVLLNPYSVIPVNPEKSPAIQAELALKFVEWLRSNDIQQQIGEFGMAKFGIPLFFPDAERVE